MNKKETLIPLAFLALSLLFIVVSALVCLSGGKLKKWISCKMRIGALILAFSFFNNGLAQLEEPDCYLIIFKESKQIQSNDTSIIFARNSEKKVVGNLENKGNRECSYCLIDEKGKKIEIGNIEFTEDKLDNPKKKFEIRLSKNLACGKYYLLLFNDKINEQNSNRIKKRISIVIKDE